MLQMCGKRVGALSAATFDGHEDDTFHEHEFVNMVSPSWTSAVAW